MSTSQSVVMVCGWGVMAGMAHSTVDERGWQVKLSDPLLTCGIPEHLKDEQPIMKCYANKASFCIVCELPSVL